MFSPLCQHFHPSKSPFAKRDANDCIDEGVKYSTSNNDFHFLYIDTHYILPKSTISTISFVFTRCHLLLLQHVTK